jgi:hypothetical protein
MRREGLLGLLLLLPLLHHMDLQRRESAVFVWTTFRCAICKVREREGEGEGWWAGGGCRLEARGRERMNTAPSKEENECRSLGLSSLFLRSIVACNPFWCACAVSHAHSRMLMSALVPCGHRCVCPQDAVAVIGERSFTRVLVLSRVVHPCGRREENAEHMQREHGVSCMDDECSRHMTTKNPCLVICHLLFEVF